MIERYCFGTVDTGRVFFNVLIGTNDVAIPDWRPQVNAVTHNVPGSNPPISITDIISFGPETVTWRVELDTREDYQALKTKWAEGQPDVLTVPINSQSHIGLIDQEHNFELEHLAGTEIATISNPQTTLDGTVECDVTFSRLIDPLTGEVVP